MSKALSDYLYADEAALVTALAKTLDWDEEKRQRTRNRAVALIHAVRKKKRKGGELESFLQQYSLSSKEGLALMALAEALLRIPDAQTANALIHDKVAAADWLKGAGGSGDWIVKATGVGLLVSRKTLESAIARVGKPFIREAMIRAMEVMGKQFVLGRDIEEAVKNAEPYRARGYKMSYDMLGEGARTADDALKYYHSYESAIEYIGAQAGQGAARRPGISVKLSALHPRYEYAQKDRCVPVLAERLLALSRKAAANNMSLIVDAEESERLEISLEIMAQVLADKSLQGWEGFGLAVQAYQKRAVKLIDHLGVLAKSHGSRLRVRVVKGAYWDAEIKRAQVLGLPDYPVFTRKANTDLSFQACAAKLFQHKDLFYPMLGTHNAQSAAAVIEMAREAGASFEFQRLHGMGEALYDILLEDEKVEASIYAPVGTHQDLLPYLVRRLLENGANSSFVNKLLDEDVPVDELAQDPVRTVRDQYQHRHMRIKMPADIYGEGRKNSKGVDLDDKAVAEPIEKEIFKFRGGKEAACLIGGKVYRDGPSEAVYSPAYKETKVGTVYNANYGLVDKAFRVAGEAFPGWSHTPAEVRALRLEKLADLLEKHMNELMALCVHEAGKTIPDALAEVREAVDFCRYYAQRGRIDFAAEGIELPGPTGERNVLSLHGRGVFVCISPWNFPLAIFTGQITAALMAGNCVIAKPAEQTPLIAMRAVQLMHEAGIPKGAVNLLPGDGHVGGMITQHEKVAGVAFTGSIEVAKIINSALADSKGPIVPLIAETGGQNAMIVDSSALPERVIDDVILSAFGSAGQRCSALRVLYVQDEVADKVIEMLRGALRELRIGDPAKLSSDTGPVIDEEALGKLQAHRKALEGWGELIAEAPISAKLEREGYYFAPCAYEIDSIKGLKGEVFGPLLHVIRYEASRLDDVIEDINATGYGLTFGIHTRIDMTRDYIAGLARAGNIYVNRSMTGAVVGVQPFGGQGLSGTGPKAGGPHYLPRFANEKAVSIDTTASGGNATLVSLGE